MPDEIDPEIAALIGGSVQEYKPNGSPPGASRPDGAVPPPDFSTLFGDMGVTAEPNERRNGDVDLSRKAFAPIERIEADKPAAWF